MPLDIRPDEIAGSYSQQQQLAAAREAAESLCAILPAALIMLTASRTKSVAVSANLFFAASLTPFAEDTAAM